MSISQTSSLGSPIHNSTFTDQLNQSFNNVSQIGYTKIESSGKKNVSLHQCEGTVHLSILSNPNDKESYEVNRLTRQIQSARQKVSEAEAMKQALTNNQDDLNNKITIIKQQILEQDSKGKESSDKYNLLLNKYNSVLDNFGVTGQQDVETAISEINTLGPAYDNICALCEKQKEKVVELNKKFDTLKEEKQKFTWKDAIDRENYVYKSSDRYTDVLENHFRRCIDNTTKQAEEIKELEEEFEVIQTENDKLADDLYIARLQKACSELDVKVKDILRKNKVLARKKHDMTLKQQKPASANPKRLLSTKSPIRKSTTSGEEKMKTSLDLYKKNSQKVESPDMRQDFNIDCNLDGTQELPALEEAPGVPHVDISYLFDGSSKRPLPNKSISLNKSGKSNAVLENLSNQMGTVKEEVKGLKDVLNESKRVVEGMLARPDRQSASPQREPTATRKSRKIKDGDILNLSL